MIGKTTVSTKQTSPGTSLELPPHWAVQFSTAVRLQITGYTGLCCSPLYYSGGVCSVLCLTFTQISIALRISVSEINVKFAQNTQLYQKV